MFSKNVLVTGSNRGIGLELVKQLAGKVECLFAACRTPQHAEELKRLTETHKNIFIVKLDVTNQCEIDAAVSMVTEKVTESGLTCLINNSGINYKMDSIEDLTAEAMRDTYNVNVVAPAMLTKAFLPLLRKASLLYTTDQICVARAAIINISSSFASIALNTSTIANRYGYRSAKVSLNMLTKNLSIELTDDFILTTSICPGWVQTDMGCASATLTASQSVSGILDTVSKMTSKHNGSFFNWENKELPW